MGHLQFSLALCLMADYDEDRKFRKTENIVKEKNIMRYTDISRRVRRL
jgi:hypothetical protein